MVRKKILVVGGTGHFGNFLVEDLCRQTECDLVVPSRSVVDLRDTRSVESALSGMFIAICAAGPFQELPMTLAELCLRRGIHYIDLSDDRNFVKKVYSLVPRDGSDLPAVCSGWSTVSALSGALARIGTAGLDRVDAIYVHMAPGNRLPRAAGTIASLLYSVGREFSLCRDGDWQTVRGWAEPRRFSFPAPVGGRAGYLVDVPDHDLFPELFHARTVEFRTASELRGLNAAVSFLGWLVRKGVVRGWASSSRMFQRLAGLFGFLGHDWGAVGVEVIGSIGGRTVTRRVSVVADSGGQRIAVMPACIMTALLLSGSKHRGLVSPADWITQEELRVECEKRGFRLVVEG
ncbi:MAG TPA: hypothetical protein VE422_20315 [Terriglobia bacterium]|nr:hypothetical protein [Terriglobia bacterium]